MLNPYKIYLLPKVNMNNTPKNASIKYKNILILDNITLSAP